jgi:hypothetical protein
MFGGLYHHDGKRAESEHATLWRPLPGVSTNTILTVQINLTVVIHDPKLCSSTKFWPHLQISRGQNTMTVPSTSETEVPIDTPQGTLSKTCNRNFNQPWVGAGRRFKVFNIVDRVDKMSTFCRKMSTTSTYIYRHLYLSTDIIST